MKRVESERAEEGTPFAEAGTKQLRVVKSTRTLGGVESLAATVDVVKV
jgi:hypothetical protein